MKKFIEEATDENVLKSIQANKYNRVKDIKDFILALDEIEDNMFISLDAKWGAGKTFYVKQIVQTLKYLTGKIKETDVSEMDPYFSNNELSNINLKYTYYPVYYNAWLYDNHDDPLMSLVLLIVKEYKGFLHTELDNSSLNDKITTLMDSFLFSIGNFQFGGNFGSAKDTFKGRDILSSVKTSEEVRACVKSVFDNIIVENVQKLVIFIDELDRCRPNFAIEMLERIKHFFDDDRIIIVASINRSQLIHSISKCYGEKFDSTGYLDKFFDRNVFLPQIDTTLDGGQPVDFVRRQICLAKVAEELNVYYRLSLRENLRFYECLARIKESRIVGDLSHQGLLLSAFIPIIAVLNIKDEEKKTKFINGDSNIFAELFNNVPVLYQLVCYFGGSKNEDSKENFEKGYVKLKEVYDYVFGTGKKKWYNGSIEISDDLKSICMRLCNGYV